MHSLTLASALLASSSLVSSLAITPRVENYVDELVWIVKCAQYWKTTDTEPQTTQDYLWYYKNYDDLIAGKNGRQPDGRAYARLPKGHPTNYEHISWTMATEDNKITATFPDQGNFWVYGLADEGDSRTSVIGHANLNGNDMRCYTKPKAQIKHKYNNGNGYETCESAFMCTRANRKIKRTKIEISNEFIEVKMKSMSKMELQSKGLEVDPVIEQNILKAMDNLQTQTGIDFSADIDPKFDEFQMTFDVKMAESEGDAQYDSTKIPRITEEIKKMAPDLAKGGRMGSCGSFYTTYGSDCFFYVPLPKQIAITVQTADQETQNWQPKDTINIRVTDGNCADNSAMSVVLVGLFAAGAGVMTGGLSAAVAGIGAVVSQAYSVSC